ncbi:E3 ubiquitin-protein ligase RNF34-like [Anneissia japonica]|uniref:E3 ubiquitin-protein ligase RNF34-like n=1 Tax=Anneissia japonica TaxID=1529436 RepID=UPI001425B4B6|nr:E3 ubiquitin-protein ligase RNF34-like [Anneissia japonica]XP_033115809.1 E3 ubiquitin-protein ligase RNF34-like [Anneissia japonica]XP_033115817.1 E3 ubiquitin-protein ligase RNF34-like [Anneissia japonica]XP_033115825.1 E3 ubiquitin-protein ligase RNF34-like [Anneissia japonica]
MGSGNVKPVAKTHNQVQLSNQSNTMPCHSCDAQFSIIRRKHECVDCVKLFCNNCINKKVKDKKICRVCETVKQDMARPALMKLKIRDLQQYLTVRHVSTESCKEKTDLVDLLIENLIENGLIPRPTPVQHSVFGPPVGESISFTSNPNSTSSSDASDPVSQQDALHSNIPENSRDIRNDFTADENETLEKTQQDVSDEEYLEESQKDFENSSVPPTVEQVRSSETTESEEAKLERLERRRQLEMREAESRLFGGQITPIPTVDPRPKKKRASLSDLQNIEGIDELSVRALKEILATNFVDYRGCVEKKELVERVKRLYISKQKPNDAEGKEDPSEETDENLCKICMDATIDCVLLECGHMVTCTKCGKVLAECPICRVFITRVVHTFKS